jgi:hypothetical protein
LEAFMTHEHEPGAEAEGGPENDDRLPDAATIPVADDPDSLPPVKWPGEWED